MTKSGTGTLVLSGPNTYTGLTTVSGGTLQIGDGIANNGVLPGSAANNAALVFANPTTVSYGGVISGNGNLTKTGTGTLILAAPSTYGGATLIANGTVRLAYNSLPQLSTVNLSLGGVPNSLGSYTISPTGGSMTITGGGGDIWTTTQQGYYVYQAVPTSQNFDVAVHIQSMSGGDGSWAKAGIYARQDTTAADVPGVFDAETTGSKVSYQWTNGNVSAGTGTSVGPNWLRLTYTASTSTFTGYESPSTSTTIPAASDPSWVAINSYTQAMSGSTFLLGIADTSHNNTAGVTDTAIFNNLGNLFVGGNGTLPATTALSIAAGSNFDLNGGTQTVNSLSDYSPGAGGSVLNSNTGAVSILTLSPTGGSTTFSGLIQGGGTLGSMSLVVSGSGLQTLAGANTYNGGTRVAGGTLQLANPQALGAGGLTANGGVLDLNGNSLTTAASNALPSFSGLAGTITDSSTGSGITTFTVSQTGSTTYSGVLVDGPNKSLALATAGSGSLNLSGSNGYSGGTTVGAPSGSGGTLQVGNTFALGTVNRPVERQ